MKPAINCVIVSYRDINEYKIPWRDIKDKSIYASDIKMQAMGYPDTIIDIVRGFWYVPADTAYGTWLLLKYPNLKTGLILVGLN